MTNVITPSVAACLDRTKMTDRGAVYVLSAAAHSLGHDVSELNINRSSIRRHRRKYRTDARVALKEELRLLNVPKLPNGTGSEMAKAVVGALEDWDLTERIGGISFDTTSSNTGRNNGFESGDSHPHVRSLLDPVDKNWFQSTLLSHKGLRDDYRELLELTVIFLG
ncbi:hypothetical protein GWK47_047038 [Chionoecetes opilio]|uniref:Uncharacterized protein n=1 Tax=Chionoecetes opilio TaxID=41210 RepID=A0A8J4Y513_CHIOP|nr:hypothetical protein GWK47_047038 [Chionoecetes opilio]